MTMLSKTAIALLAKYTFCADAQAWVSYIPFSGIAWNDEMPPCCDEFSNLPEPDRLHILRLYGLRSGLWRGHVLSPEDQDFLNVIRSQVPDWAFFRHDAISGQQLEADESVKEAMNAFEAELDADSVSVTQENCVRRISATYDLTKASFAGVRQPWWRRTLHRVRLLIWLRCLAFAKSYDARFNRRV